MGKSRSRIAKLYLKVIVKGLFPKNYIKVKHDTIIVKNNWYSIKKVVIPIEELIAKTLPQLISISCENIGNVKAFVSSVKRLKTEEEKIELLYIKYINLSLKAVSDISVALLKHINSNSNFTIITKHSVLNETWRKLLLQFREGKPKKVKLELLPSTSIVSAQELIMENKKEIIKTHRYGNITVSATEIKNDPILVQQVQNINGSEIITNTLISN